MIINYDRNPALNTDQKLQSLIDSIQMALTENGSSDEVRKLLNTIYPVGSFYETTDSRFNPSSAWGGTWTMTQTADVYRWHRIA